MILAGVDLAWQSEKNPSAICFGNLLEDTLTVSTLEPAIFGIEEVLNSLRRTKGLHGIAIDAPLIINNRQGQRICEKEIGREYGSRHASCHTSNRKLYPNAKSVFMSEALNDDGYSHISGENWQIECYPHPAIIEIFSLKERLKYKKGRVADKKEGQKNLAQLIRRLSESKVLKLEFSDEGQIELSNDYIETLSGQALKSNEDGLDAVLCLYIAGLYARNVSGHVFGDVGTGYIWVPQRACI